MYYYELNGKTIKIRTFDELLNFNEQEAIANNLGTSINNPFFDTHSNNEEDFEEEITYIDIPDISELDVPELDEDIED